VPCLSSYQIVGASLGCQGSQAKSGLWVMCSDGSKKPRCNGQWSKGALVCLVLVAPELHWCRLALCLTRLCASLLVRLALPSSPPKQICRFAVDNWQLTKKITVLCQIYLLTQVTYLFMFMSMSMLVLMPMPMPMPMLRRNLVSSSCLRLVI
jgi:hypothetical protein